MTTARPILFSAPMVQALLAGRKTQTRRITKPNPPFAEGDNITCQWAVGNEKCPYGKPGDLLWVRETWQVRGFAFGKPISETRIAAPSAFHYRATDDGAWKPYWGKWRPSIFMPRWASRLTLAITDVRLERLQDICEDDARAEGLAAISKDGGRTVKFGIPDRDGLPGSDNDGWDWSQWCIDPRAAYFTLWDKINGDSAHLTNPFVWVLTFDVHKTNVDAYLKQTSEAA